MQTIFKVKMLNKIQKISSRRKFLIATISSPSQLYIDSISTSNINCRGANTGSVMYMINGGKRYTNLEYYNYYLIVNSDTIANCDINGCPTSFSSSTNCEYHSGSSYSF